MIGNLLRSINPVRAVRAMAQVLQEARRAAKVSGRSTAAITFDVVRLRATTGLSRQEYFIYELYNRPDSIERRAYLADYGSMQIRVWKRLNPPQYWPFFHDKYLFNAAARAFGLPVPVDLGFFDPEFGRSTDGRPLRTAADIADWLAGPGPDDLVIKPVNGIEGRMVLVFQGRHRDRRETLVTLDGREFSPAALFVFMTDQVEMRREFSNHEVRSFLFEERVRLHPALADFLGETLCCARVLTLVGKGSEPLILRAVMKLQTSPSGLDNLAHGAVVAQIDPETGTLGEGRDASDPRMPWRKALPGTGREFVGLTLPDWSRAREVALRAAAAFPWCRCIGWDIALSDRGPVLIEANERWGAKIVQVAAGRGLMEGDLLAVYEHLQG